ncbi:MAG: quinolinate synthase NadA [Planctomycetota bacterium]
MQADALKREILALKAAKQAVILCHIYQMSEVQDVADYVGDSLGLSQEAARTDANLIIFCGVHFMAETAAILNPGKKVLIPDPKAGCPMADMIDPAKLQALKDQHPGAPVLCYVNSTAAVKALSDICVTSANALKIARQIPEKKIILVPDKYLGIFVQRQVDKEVILYNGYCPTHMKISPRLIDEARAAHPKAVVMVHPECLPEVQDKADHVLSTGQMCDMAAKLPAKEFIIGTEEGITYTLSKRVPGKHFYPIQPMPLCPNMKKITLAKVLTSLQDEVHVVTVAPDMAKAAGKSIRRMLEMS